MYITCVVNIKATVFIGSVSAFSKLPWVNNFSALLALSLKVGQTFKCIIDRKEGAHFVGRTEFDSPDVDNEVLIDATKTYLKTGEFTTVKITEAADYDLYADVVK